MDMSEARCSNGVPGVEADNVCCGPQCVTCGVQVAASVPAARYDVVSLCPCPFDAITWAIKIAMDAV